MSPLLRDELRILLCPERVLITRIGRAMTLRGLERQVIATEILACDASSAGAPPWAPATSRLAEALPALASGRVFGTVIVSNHFMRYTVVPSTETLTDAAEQAAYARHCFKMSYGSASETWDLRVSAGRPGLSRLASAMDSGLLEALRAAFLAAGSPLVSVQPQLMAAYNQCRAALQKGAGWFVLHEAGSLCIALLKNTCFLLVKTVRVGPGWLDQLPALLEREACLAGSEPRAATVYLWAPELGGAAAPCCRGFEVRKLMTTMPASFIPGTRQKFSAAVQP